MDKTFQPAEWESKLYTQWEEGGVFHADNTSKKPSFTIVLPPPNANADLHLGHAMYVYEDIMIRYYKSQGFETLWLPGADHAGFETQFVFEKHLKKQGKSRFDYDRDTLYQMIWDFVHENRGNMENQLRRLGFALDWDRMKFTLDEDGVKIVKETFVQMYREELIYRDMRLVNYCTHCGTSFSDLEVVDEAVTGKMYYIDFPIDGEAGNSIQIATTRPETLLGDVAVMVNPKDKRYLALVGKNVLLPIAKRIIPIIADEYVDAEFGTGAVKVTPFHDFNDFEIAKKTWSDTPASYRI
jgi:valyl-tRNA synthetase